MDNAELLVGEKNTEKYIFLSGVNNQTWGRIK